MAAVRDRFSPAPSGELHVGDARTALFNWLYARHHGGTFLLRIEDTDRSRTRDEWVAGIQDTLRWLGLDWDEGPVLQSERTDQLPRGGRPAARGRPRVRVLLHRGRAQGPERRRGRGRPPAGLRRPLPRPHGRAARRAGGAEGRPSVVRFRTPDTGVSRFHDLVRGEVEVEWSTIRDFVIVRSDGTPIFFLANAVDDLDMGITHVIRGEDLLDTTHRVLALRDALGGGAASRCTRTCR